MGRVVLLHFEDIEDLAVFYNRHNDEGTEGIIWGEYYVPSPRVYCRCPNRIAAHNWRRHKKFGLWVCKACGKPSRVWRTGLRQRLEEALGKNLLSRLD